MSDQWERDPAAIEAVITGLRAELAAARNALVAIRGLRVKIGDRDGSPQEHFDWARELAKEALDGEPSREH